MADAYCDRCGNTFVQHMMSGWQCCIGCARPSVLFRMEIIEVKPMDAPVSKIFDFDREYDKAKEK